MREKTEKLKVLIADKTSHTRLVLEDLLSEPDITVTGMATNGEELLEKLKETKADVVLLDLDLPQNKNLFTLKQIFSEAPTPLVLLVSLEKLTLPLLEEVIALGVYAVVVKPDLPKGPGYRAMQSELLYKIRSVREMELWDPVRLFEQLTQRQRSTGAIPVRNLPEVDTVIVLGASTGGTQAIESIVRQLAPDLQACVLIAVHLPATFTKSFTQRLNEVTPLPVLEGKAGLQLRKGKIIVAPGDRNMVVKTPVLGITGTVIGFSEDAVASFDKPSVDLLMQSVAVSAVRNVLGVILTGMGKDGTLGAGFIRHRGGTVIAQDEATSAIFGMAKSVIDKGLIDKVLPLEQIATYINNFAAAKHGVSLTGDFT